MLRRASARALRATQRRQASSWAAPVRISRVLHTEEKEIRKSGLPLAGSAGLASAGLATAAAAGAPNVHDSALLAEPEIQFDVVNHVPWLSVSHRGRRHDATIFLAEVFRVLAANKLETDLVSTSVSDIAVTLLAPLSSTQLDALQVDLDLLGVRCNYDPDGSVIHCSSDSLPRSQFDYELFRIFSLAGLHPNMLVSKRAMSTVSVVLPRAELDSAIAEITRVTKPDE